jgi:hypothetical protein
MLASIRKHKQMWSKNCLSFSIPILTPPLLPPPQPQINFNNKKKGDVLNDCLMSVDGTDFRVPQKGTVTKGNAFVPHKYAGKSVLCYKLSVSILEGDLVWIQGPYPTS